MGFKNNKKNTNINGNNGNEQKKTGIGAAFRNAKNNVCDAMDKVTPGHGAAAAIGAVAGAGAVYGISKMAQRKASQAECAASDEEFVDRRRR